MNATVFKFFGVCEIDREYDYTTVYLSKDFVIVYTTSPLDCVLISVSLHNSFNKQGDCPLQILITPDEKISRRKEKRIFNAINHMLRNKDSIPSWGDLDGFDDLGRDNYVAFYNQWS